MTTKQRLAAFLAVSFLFLAGCGKAGGCSCDRSAPVEQQKPSAAVYTCPMHPEVIQASPGKCPKCGMDLVRKE